MYAKKLNALLLMFLVWLPILATGEEVVVQVETTSVRVENTIIGSVAMGQRFKVLQRNGAWVGIEFADDTGSLARGWIHTNHVRSLVGEESTAPKDLTAVLPDIDLKVDFLQLSVNAGSQGPVLRMRADVQNRGSKSLPCDFSKFRLQLDDEEISQSKQNSYGYLNEQVLVGFDLNGWMLGERSVPNLGPMAGGVPAGGSLVRWLQFRIPMALWREKKVDFDQIAKKVLLTGTIDGREFKVNLRTLAQSSIPRKLSDSKIDSSIPVIDFSGGLNALNFSAFAKLLPAESRDRMSVIGLVSGENFYIDHYCLKKLGLPAYGTPYLPSQRMPPFALCCRRSGTDVERSQRTRSPGNRVRTQLPIMKTETAAALHVLAARPNSYSAIIKYLDNTDAVTRAIAASVLARHNGKPDVLQSLVKSTQDTDQGVRIAAIRALSGAGAMGSNGMPVFQLRGFPAKPSKEVLSAIVNALKDPNTGVQSAAISASRNFNHPEVIAALIAGLSSQDAKPHLVSSSCRALGHLKAKSAVQPLQDMRRKLKDRQTRSLPIRALGEIGTLNPLEVAIAQLNEGEIGYQDIQILKESRDSRIVPGLIAYMSEGTQSGYGNTLIEMLAASGDKRAIKPLIAQLRYGNQYDDQAIAALGDLGDASAIAPLREALQAANSNSRRRKAIYIALVKLGDEETFTDVFLFLKAPGGSGLQLRDTLSILGNSSNPFAIRTIAKYLDDDDNSVYLAAIQALIQSGTPSAIKAIEQRLLSEDFENGPNIVMTLRSTGSQHTLRLLHSALKSSNAKTKSVAQQYLKSLESQALSRARYARLGTKYVPIKVDHWLNKPQNSELPDRSGKVILLNFWSIWSDTSLRMLPHLRRWQEQFGPDAFEVVGLTDYSGMGWDRSAGKAIPLAQPSIQNEREAMEQFASAQSLTYKLGFLEPGGRAFKDYQIAAVPWCVVIDQAGEIKLATFGSEPESLERLEKTIRELVDSGVSGDAQAILDAKQTSRPLTNGRFLNGLEGWTLEGPRTSVGIFDTKGKPAVTTYGDGKRSNVCRLSQCFKVPEDAVRLSFKIHGGGDRNKNYVALWSEGRRHGLVTSNYNNTPREKNFPLTKLQGKVAVLEIVDKNTDSWGHIGVQEFLIVRESDTVDATKNRQALELVGAKVQTYEDGEVYSVELPPGSTDNTLATLRQITSLRRVALSGRGITDAGLQHLAGLKNLNQLWIRMTSIEGSGLKNLESIEELTDISLQGERITDQALATLKNFPGITNLVLEDLNVTDEGFAHLRDLAGLTELKISSLTNVTDRGLSHLAELKGVKRLTISRMDITDAGIAGLKDLSSLFAFELKDVPITGEGLESFGDLKGFKQLTLRNTGLTKAGFDQIKDLKNLMGLHIYGGLEITDSEMQKLKSLGQLEALTLDRVAISDSGVEPLKSLKNLKRMYLSGVPISQKVLYELRSSLPGCSVSFQNTGY